MLTTLTYGTMPDRETYDLAWDLNVDGPRYHIHHGTPQPAWVPSGDYTREGLWQALNRLCRAFYSGNEAAGEWASSILASLDIEWV